MGYLVGYFDYEAFGRDLLMYDYALGAYRFGALARQRNNNVFHVICPPLTLSPLKGFSGRKDYFALSKIVNIISIITRSYDFASK